MPAPPLYWHVAAFARVDVENPVNFAPLVSINKANDCQSAALTPNFTQAPTRIVEVAFLGVIGAINPVLLGGAADVPPAVPADPYSVPAALN